MDKKANMTSKRKAPTSKSGKSHQSKNLITKKKDAPKREQVPEKSQNIWISGLSPDTKAAQLKELFVQHGKVVAAKVVTTAKSPGSKCFGFVTMATLDEAKKCVEKLNKTQLNGQTISIDLARSQPLPDSKSGDEKRVSADPKSKRRSTITWNFKDKEIKVINMDDGDKKGELRVETRMVEAKKREEPKGADNKSPSTTPQRKPPTKNDDSSRLVKTPIAGGAFKSSLLTKSRVYSHNIVAKHRALNMRQRQEAWKLQKESHRYKERLARSHNLPLPNNDNGPPSPHHKTSTGLKYSVSGDNTKGHRAPFAPRGPPNNYRATNRRINNPRERRGDSYGAQSLRPPPPNSNTGGYRGNARPRPTYSFYTPRSNRGRPGLTPYRGRRPLGGGGLRGNATLGRGGFRGTASSRFAPRSGLTLSYNRPRPDEDRNVTDRRNLTFSRGRRIQPTDTRRFIQRGSAMARRSPPQRTGNGLGPPRFGPFQPGSSKFEQRRRFDSGGSGGGGGGIGLRSLISRLPVAASPPTFASAQRSDNFQPRERDFAPRRSSLTSRQNSPRQPRRFANQSSLLGPQPSPAATAYRNRNSDYGSRREGVRHMASPPRSLKRVERGPPTQNAASMPKRMATYNSGKSSNTSEGGLLRESPLGSGRYHHSFPARPSDLGSARRPAPHPGYDGTNVGAGVRPRSPPYDPFKGAPFNPSGRDRGRSHQRQPGFGTKPGGRDGGGGPFNQGSNRTSSFYDGNSQRANNTSLRPQPSPHVQYFTGGNKFQPRSSLLGEYQSSRVSTALNRSRQSSHSRRSPPNIGGGDRRAQSPDYRDSSVNKRRRLEPHSPPAHGGNLGMAAHAFQAQNHRTSARGMLISPPTINKRPRQMDLNRSQQTFPSSNPNTNSSRMGPPPTTPPSRRYENSSKSRSGYARGGSRGYYHHQQPHQQDQSSSVGCNSLGSLILGGGGGVSGIPGGAPSYRTANHHHLPSYHIGGPNNPNLSQTYGPTSGQDHGRRSGNMMSSSTRATSPPPRRSRNGPPQAQQPTYHYKRY